MDIENKKYLISKETLNNLSNSFDKLTEKGSIEMIEKDVKESESNDEKDLNIYHQNERKQFDYDTLNRDLADIEERLRQTRLSWRKDGRVATEDFSEAIMKVDGVRKSLSMLDIDKRTYSSASSLGDVEKYDGEKRTCESPALSDGLLKWDYGADIGLDQNDSDLEPITWPVTAEEAQRNERDAINRKMRQSLSQGSFLASPDPEDKHNLISRFSEELKSKKGSSSQCLSNRKQYSSISILSEGKYDDVSARQIMEQAEAAEKRLRERLEAVKSLHLNNKPRSREMLDDKEVHSMNETGSFSNQTRVRRLSDISNKTIKDNFILDTTKAVRSNETEEDLSPETHKGTIADDRSRSPASVSNTGRTTTIESTHTFSDYGKAPVFQPDAYGSRTDCFSNDNASNMYAKRSRDRSTERGRSVCGIAPDLDTISSRETLHMTEEKKENSAGSVYCHHEEDSKNQSQKDITGQDHMKVVNETIMDDKQDGGLQAKWDRFKMIRKEDEYDQLYEKTTVRNAVQYNPQNSHRQVSSATTFTTITNVSPRYDSFATENIRPTIKDNFRHDFMSDNYDAAEKEHKNKIPTGKIQSTDGERRTDYHRSDTNQSPNSKPGRRILGGNGGGKDDNDDEDLSQTEKRRMRHSGGLRKMKKKFGSSQLDGETTASELEHDDTVKNRQRCNDRVSSQRLSKMLTHVSRRAVTEEVGFEPSCHSDSTSVDTMQLMNRMSNLLGKQKTKSSHRNDMVMPMKEKVHRKPSIESTNYSNKITVNKMTKISESEDGMLVLKHLMLKQKVKWLADCAREEARRRKVKKLQKLIDMYEQGDHVIIPSDLETDTATLMGSERGSQNDLDSHTDSFSQNNEMTQNDYNEESMVDQISLNNQTKPQNLRQEYYDYRHSKDSKPQKYQNVTKKCYPPSQAWHVPLRESTCKHREDANASNWSQNKYHQKHRRMPQRYRSPCSMAESIQQEKPVNLSAKERVRIKYELEMARQRNAHECQKDIRHSKTGNTKVNAGGLAWTVGNELDSENQRFDHRDGENQKGKVSTKSVLQIAFEDSMSDFISRSRQRQKRIKLAAEERRYESQMIFERAKLFAGNGTGNCVPKRRPLRKSDPLSENLYKPRRRTFSKTEMKVQSARKYETLPEVQAKYIDERRKARIQNNRMRMQLYGERILQSVLRNRAPWVSEGR